jgi:hypothetical protein
MPLTPYGSVLRITGVGGTFISHAEAVMGLCCIPSLDGIMRWLQTPPNMCW